jgi:hypothetical protein
MVVLSGTRFCMDNHLLKKIRDLLRLQRRASTEGEAQAAAFALGRLLTKHQLDLASIETDVDRERAAIDNAPVDSFGRLCRWRMGIANALCRHAGVSCWLRTEWDREKRQRRMSILLCGRPADTAAVHALYSWLVLEGQRICGTKGYTYKKRNDWLLGFASGIGTQLQRAKSEAAEEHVENPGSCVSMVLADRASESEELMRKTIGNPPDHKMRPIEVDIDVYRDGQSGGRTVHLGRSLGDATKQLEQGGDQ